jgi:biopolymer transport protein ExbB/TolQ
MESLKLVGQWFPRLEGFVPAPAARFMLIAAGAAALVVGLATLHHGIPLGQEPMTLLNGTRMRWMVFERGPIPYVIVWAFLVGVAHVLLAYVRVLLPAGRHAPENEALAHAAERGDGHDLRAALMDPLQSKGRFADHVRKVVETAASDPDYATLRTLPTAIVETEEASASKEMVTIDWAEMVLPLLGFLGTIVGMAGAIDKIGQQLLLGNANRDILRQGFQEVALAFETTFLGLVGAMVMASGSAALRHALARRIDEQRLFLERVVAIVISGSQVGELTRIKHLREAEQTMLLELVHAGQHEIFQDMRNVLLDPIVQFSQDNGFSERLQTEVARSLGGSDFHIERLGLPSRLVASANGWGVLIASRGHQRSLIRVGPEGSVLESRGIDRAWSNFDALIPSADLNVMLAVGAGGKGLFLVECASGRHNSVNLDGMDGGTWCSRGQTQIDGREFAVLEHSDGATRRLCWREVTADRPTWGTHIMPGGENYCWSLAREDAVVFAVWVSGRSTHIGRVDLREALGDALRGSRLQALITAEADITVTQILAMTREQLLAVDGNGQPLHLDTAGTGRLQRVAVDRWGNQAKLLLACSEPWIAVLQGGDLHMWRMSGRRLSPYIEGGDAGRTFRIGQLPSSSFTLSTDRGRLHAVKEQTVLTWSFPVYPIDQVR